MENRIIHRLAAYVYNARMGLVEEKANRFWRPRFSVRTLVIILTVSCAYFACWEPTRQEMLKPVPVYGNTYPIVTESSVPLPLVIERYEIDKTPSHMIVYRRRYYLWLFGPKIKLPLESDYIPEP